MWKTEKPCWNGVGNANGQRDEAVPAGLKGVVALAVLMMWGTTGLYALSSPGFAPDAWRAREQSAAPRPGAGGVVRFSCSQGRPGAVRSSWDLPLSLDLRSSRGLRLQVCVSGIEPGMSFSFYLKSGNGWHVWEFFPETPGAWENIDLLKSDAGIEGLPAGWGRIETMRLAVWHGEQRNVSLDLAGINLLPATPGVTVFRLLPGFGATDRLAANYARKLCAGMAATGIFPAVWDIPDVAPGCLSPENLAIVPFCEEMPEPLEKLLLTHLRQGGRLLTFYSQPAAILNAMGIRLEKYLGADKAPAGFAHLVFPEGLPAGAPRSVLQESWNIHAMRPEPGRGRVLANWYGRDGRDTGEPAVLAGPGGIAVSHVYLGQDDDSGPQMLLALAAQLQPELWRTAAGFKIPNAGVPRNFADFASARAEISGGRPHAGTATALNSLRQAEDLAGRARQRWLAGDARGAVLDAMGADRAGADAFFWHLPAMPGENRGLWCHRAAGMPGLSWETSARFLASAGITMIMPNIGWGGKAYYQSRVIPVAADLAAGKDLLAESIAAGRKHGLAVHAWKICFKLGDGVSPALVNELQRQNRLQCDIRGTMERSWLCPANPENQERELLALEELARNYQVDGIHLDYVRFAGENYCFCQHCRQAFELFIKRRLDGWPEIVRNHPETAKQWRTFRQAQISGFVSAVRGRLKKINPQLQLSAAVFANAFADIDKVGQDWTAWCRNNDLDFVTPMNYFRSPAEFERVVHNQRQLLRDSGTKLFPGIGMEARELDIASVANQVLAARRQQTGGFVIFDFSPRAAKLLPQLSKGLTRR